MEKKSNLILIILGIFLVGNICLLCSYIFVYLVAGQEVYANEIMALTDIRVLLSQLFISGIGSLTVALLGKMLISLVYRPTIQDTSLKNLIKVCIISLLNLTIYFIIFWFVFDILFSKETISDNLLAGYTLFIVIAMILGAIGYITVQGVKELNKTLLKRKQQKLKKD